MSVMVDPNDKLAIIADIWVISLRINLRISFSCRSETRVRVMTGSCNRWIGVASPKEEVYTSLLILQTMSEDEGSVRVVEL